MKTILLFLCLLISTSFSSNKPIEETWIGTFEVFQNEKEEFIIYYKGKYSECFTKFVIDRLFENCDSINRKINIDSLIEISDVHEVEPDKIKKIKI